MHKSLQNLIECGLNADWSVPSWHLGPSSTPNMNSGDYYIVDNEEGSYELIKYTFDDLGDNPLMEMVSSCSVEDDPIILIKQYEMMCK